MPPTLKDVADYLGLTSELEMASKLGLKRPISTLALIEAYKKLPPKARFSVNPSYGQMPLNVQFTDKSLGHVTKWEWKFDDGGTSSEPNPSHPYRAPKQEYTGSDFKLLGCSAWLPTLTASNQGGSDTASGSVDVSPAPPHAKIDLAEAQEANPLTWDFGVDWRTSGYCLTHQWDFGDPASGSKNTATTSGQEGTQHTYSGSGSFTVVVTVTNPAGSSSAAKTIKVTGAPGSGTGSTAPPPIIEASFDPSSPGMLVISGTRFTVNGTITVNITTKDSQGQVVPVVSPSPTVFANGIGVLDPPQKVSVAPCSGSGPDKFTVNVQAVDQSGAKSNTVSLDCYATNSP